MTSTMPAPVRRDVPVAARDRLYKIGALHRAGETTQLQLGELLARVQHEFGLSCSLMAPHTGIRSAVISQYIAIAVDLDPSLRQLHRDGVLSFRIARALSRFENQARQRELAGLFLSDDRNPEARKRLDSIVSLAKANPMLTAEQVLAVVIERPAPGESQAAHMDEVTVPPAPEAFPGQCPRCLGQLFTRPETHRPGWYVSCMHCGFESS